MISRAQIAERAAVEGLQILGVAPAMPEDDLKPGIKSLVLLGPNEPGFWHIFQRSDEAKDGEPDPLDRWSRRVIGRMACDLGGKAYLPFGGPRGGRSLIGPSGAVLAGPRPLGLSFMNGWGFSFRSGARSESRMISRLNAVRSRAMAALTGPASMRARPRRSVLKATTFLPARRGLIREQVRSA